MGASSFEGPPMVANLKSREGAAASAARMLIAGISLAGAAALTVGVYCLRSLAPPPPH